MATRFHIGAKSLRGPIDAYAKRFDLLEVAMHASGDDTPTMTVASMRRWRKAGVRCGICSDGAACNNRLDTFHEMSLAAGIGRALHPEQPLSAREVLALATCDGARALGLGERVGSLEVGKQADVIVVSADAPHHAPNPERDPYDTLVHAARASDVRLTMVAGRVLYRDGAWATLDAPRAIADARAEAQGLVRRAERAASRA